MKKLILTLLLIIFMIPGVNADTLITFEEFEQEFCSSSALNNSYYNVPTDYTSGTLYFTDSLYYKTGGRFYHKYILLKSETTYSIIGNNYFNFNILFFDTNFNFLNSLEISLKNAGKAITFDTPFTSNKYLYMFYSVSKKTDYDNFYFFEGIAPEDWSQHSIQSIDCPTILNEPDIEPEPTIEPDTTLDSFYTLYLDKMKILANYTLENKFLLGAIGIILLFAILELILYLFNKGGYRR